MQGDTCPGPSLREHAALDGYFGKRVRSVKQPLQVELPLSKGSEKPPFRLQVGQDTDDLTTAPNGSFTKENTQ